jgi:putative FmdB family regulatory protein
VVNGPYKAEYKCTQCQHRFDIMQGPGAPPSAKVCPKCRHKWVEWLNYETLKKSRFNQTVPY